MKNDCSVVKDLIPLYAEGLVSEETKEFIYEHCQSCEKCKGLLDTIADFSDSKETIDDRKEKMWNDIANKERKKKRKRYILLSFGVLTLILVTVYIYSFVIKGNTWFAEYDYTYTEQTIKQSKFSENDIHAAAEEVKRYFKNNFEECVLLRLSYDEELTLDKTYYPEYTELMVFESDYYMLKEPVAGDSNHMKRNWHWIVIHDSDGKWKVVSCGYG